MDRTVPLNNISRDEIARQKLMEEILLLLGHKLIDIELEPDHLNLAIDRAIDRYRTRSTNSVEESFLLLTLLPDTNVYYLPNEVMEVTDIFRRGTSGNLTGGTFFDPFQSGIVTAIYSVPFASGTTGNLALYESALQYQELVGRLFGYKLNYTWEKTTKKLTFMRKFVAPEDVFLWVYNYKPEGVLLNSYDSRQWIRDYSVAAAKEILGQARSFIGSLPGPGGGVTLNGADLIAQAREDMARLEEEVSKQADGQSEGYWFIIG
jgi:hypothetical protein